MLCPATSPGFNLRPAAAARYINAKDLVGLIENGARGGRFFIQIAPHADELRALARKHEHGAIALDPLSEPAQRGWNHAVTKPPSTFNT
jgi:hypothetical protein